MTFLVADARSLKFPGLLAADQSLLAWLLQF